MNIELFPYSGGMAEGFRRAGIEFDLAFDHDPDACASYEANLGHRPVQMDARDLLRMVRAGWQPTNLITDGSGDPFLRVAPNVDLLVADPPCTPWSRAGKRQGTGDERDMILITVELIHLLRPRCYLIGNVPGLDDEPNWPIVQRALAPLAAAGYCVADFLRLDAADYGVPQHRVRPFWFGHVDGPCLKPPAPTHGDPEFVGHGQLHGVDALHPWVTCREALGHLPPAELGRLVRMVRGRQNDKEVGSRIDRPARVVGTSNLSNGNIIAVERKPDVNRSPANPDAPIRAVTGARSQILLANTKHPINTLDAPSMTVTTKGNMQGGQGAACLALDEKPSRQKRPPSTKGAQWSRVHSPDSPAPTILTDIDRKTGNGVKLEWPWDRPSTTIARDPRIPPPGHKPEHWGALLSGPDAILLSERAAAILQGFPERWVFAGKTKTSRWSQLGQAMPPPLAEAVARSVREQMERVR